MKTIIFFALLLGNLHLFSQDSEIEKLDTLFKQNKFDEILTYKTQLNEETLSATSLYIIGIAYFDRKSYHEAIEYFDKAIKKGSRRK
ncbi:MAG TPA: tetratricopeptide repeat protein [Ignavibacteria bacterium]|nr:tetratricopeptide repeat protein [Ignavibacteria bacterium]HMQ98493.1 tetratricopeptide repeat protein [Ignavibacteria bacterium]